MLQLKVVTPEGEIYASTEVTGITMPTQAGVISVYDDHEPLISLLQPGELAIEKADHTSLLVISSGVVEIRPGSIVNLLVETAERAEEIDLERAEAARARAEAYLESKHDIEEEEFARIQAKLQKELARIDVAARFRKRR